MKKIISVLLCLILVMSFVGCGENAEQNVDDSDKAQSSQPTEDSESSTETNQTDDEVIPETEPVPLVISDPNNGTILEIDLSIRGEIRTDAPDIHTNQMILNGVTVEMPIQMSAMYASGWYMPESYYEQIKDSLLKPNKTTSLISYFLKNEEDQRINLLRVFNEANTEATIDSCAISEFSIGTNYFYNDRMIADLILPGGICMKSTAADVIAVFGMPENNPYFNQVAVSESGISYYDHKDTGVSYHFSFYSKDRSSEWEGYISTLRIVKDY